MMMVDVGEFIGKLRDRFAVKQDAHNLAVMSAFDRACVEVLVAEHREQKTELTSGQKAARTRKANREKRQALGAHPLAGMQHTNSVEQDEVESV